MIRRPSRSKFSAAGSKLLLTRLKLAMKHKSAVNLLLLALLIHAVGLRAGQAAAANRLVGDSPQKSTRAARGAGSAREIDVCALLTRAEIEGVRGEPVKETRPSSGPTGGFLTLQCFFRTTTSAKSVSLALAVPDPAKPSAPGPRGYWQRQFHPPEQPEKEKDEPAAGHAKAPKKTEEEREKELSKPRPVGGIGEEAYWVGNRISGALYVLKGNAFLRISVGGEKDEPARIAKTKTLAQKALKRLDGSR